MLTKTNYSFIGLLIALIYWFADSTIHYFLYNEESFEWVPSDFNELWMRTLIFLLFIGFGAYAQEKKKMQLRFLREQEVAQEQFKESIQKLVNEMDDLSQQLYVQMDSKEIIINKLIASLDDIRNAAEKTDGIPDEFLILVNKVVSEAADKIQALCELNNMDNN